jgi:death on curing protein
LAGVRDQGLLDSALSKPRRFFAFQSPTLAEMAASYAAGIIPNHPFLDGNKRTGFMLAATFLELNGMEFTATEESVTELTLVLASGKLKQAAYAEWLSKNSKPG